MGSVFRFSASILLGVILVASHARGDHAYYGKALGSFSQVAHGVSGEVYAVDASRLLIRGFSFDGKAPDTFFWAGATNQPSAMGEELYHNQEQTKLGLLVNATLVISTPVDKTITDFKWLAVWCRSASANFGQVLIPEDLEVPAAHNLGRLNGMAHGVEADNVWVLDSNTIRFESLSYDGSAPDAYFWAGEGSPNSTGMPLTWRPGSDQKLHRAFNNETIVVFIPPPLTIYDLDYVGLWCMRYEQNFGHHSIPPNTLNVPPALCGASRCEYYGQEVGVLSGTMHGVAGKVYALSATQFLLQDFTYDGAGMDAVLLVGTGDMPEDGGTVLWSDNGEVLAAYNRKNLVVEVPSGYKISDYTWLSVWSRTEMLSYGHVSIPADLALPEEHDLGPLTGGTHDVGASSVLVVDSVTFLFVDFTYDGQGPDTFLWAGETTQSLGSGYPLSWRPGEDQILPRSFNKENVKARLPPGLSVFDMTHVGVWCRRARADFGHIQFSPQFLNVPAHLPQMQFPNCAVMDDDQFQVSWRLTNTHIVVQLRGRVGRDHYLSFGLSGSQTMTLMDGSDVAVAWEAQDGNVKIEDYNLESKQQCTVDSSRMSVGACEDTAANGVNDVEAMSSDEVDGIREFTYSRKLVTGDSLDQDWPTDGTVFVSWAMGAINPSGRAAKHTKAPQGDVKINFGQQSSVCPPFRSAGPGEDLEPWPKITLAHTNSLKFQIGQNGGKRGYDAITGQVGWGIAWYINGLLIPELTVVRGQTYEFTVQGGDDPSLSARYHPLYITDDPVGGYAQQSDDEKQGVKIYVEPHSGPYCEWEAGQPFMSPDLFDTFADYKATLRLSCDESTSTKPTFTWTPDADTPDQLYYQCYTHQFLGWKINVVDTLPTGAGVRLLASLATLATALAAARWLY